MEVQDRGGGGKGDCGDMPCGDVVRERERAREYGVGQRVLNIVERGEALNVLITIPDKATLTTNLEQG